MSETPSQPLDRHFACMIAELRAAQGRGAPAPIQVLIIAALIRVLVTLERICREWQAGQLPSPAHRVSLYRPAASQEGAIPLRFRRYNSVWRTKRAHAAERPTRRDSAPNPAVVLGLLAPTPGRVIAMPAMFRHVPVRPAIAPWRALRPPDSSKRHQAPTQTHNQNITISIHFECYRGSRHIGRRARTGSSRDQSPASISCPFGNGARGSSPSDRTTRSSL